MTDKIRPIGKMPNKPIKCKSLIAILKRKLNGETEILSGEARNWLKCKIEELTR